MKTFKLNIVLSLIASLIAVNVNASHIIGGDLSYRCLGYDPVSNSNTYRFTMKIYRNCNQFSMDILSDPAPVTIYRGNSAPYDSIQNIYVGLMQPTIDIPPDVSNPCLTLPPDICVEQGTYIFEVTLPVIDESYHIIYQRCCRNANISNIMDPSMTGATYSIEVTRAAQRVCNNSPVFNEFPPIVICANEPINFDHSATDLEGDQLVYEFCSPLQGAGVLGAFRPGSPTECEGFRPDPACPPPFVPVNYILPAYSALEPMKGDPIVYIDNATGLIDGVPDILGQFVVGICVKEYRNGELLSLTRRDFQFNVTTCEPLVAARIESDETIGDQHFLINACGETDVLLKNLSVQRANINQFFWELDILGNKEVYNDWSPLVTFPDTGIYNGALYLNPNSDCGDTAYVTINVFPDINADFSFTYDTCVAGPVTFTDLSSSEGGPIVDWSWNMANRITINEQHPAYQFPDPGDHLVQLRVVDANDCAATENKIINWFPAPALIVVEPSSFIGCEPLDIVLNNLSTPIDDSYTIIWDLGDGNISTDISPSFTYEMPGIYSLSVEITSPLGCFVEESWSNWIEVLPNPVADFTFSPERLSNFNSEAMFTDQSIDAVAWYWDFDGLGTSFLQNPVFNFPDTGQQIVSLIVTHPLGCQDTLSKLLDVEPQVRYFLPNAFTPNSDDVNDVFKGAGFFEGLQSFQLQIWNRWGELLFESNDPDSGWNGRKENIGKMLPDGIYVCLVRYQGPRGQLTELKGFATLLK